VGQWPLTLDAVQQAREKDRNMLEQHAELVELRRRFESLTVREREMVRLVVRGLLNKQIAAELGTTWGDCQNASRSHELRNCMPNQLWMVHIAERLGVRRTM
jgi:FixJ family two-component response regulator